MSRGKVPHVKCRSSNNLTLLEPNFTLKCSCFEAMFYVFRVNSSALSWPQLFLIIYHIYGRQQKKKCRQLLLSRIALDRMLISICIDCRTLIVDFQIFADAKESTQCRDRMKLVIYTPTICTSSRHSTKLTVFRLSFWSSPTPVS